jgi:hypothetical protein
MSRVKFFFEENVTYKELDTDPHIHAPSRFGNSKIKDAGDVAGHELTKIIQVLLREALK